MRTFIPVLIMQMVICCEVSGDVATYLSAETWHAAAGTTTLIDFTGFPDGTPITNQYEDCGVLFTDGADFINYSSAYQNDGVGLQGGLPDQIIIDFDVPLHSVAVYFPGVIRVSLYNNGVQFYTSPIFHDGLSRFVGVISDAPFDRVRYFASGVNIDDLLFGPPIPAPGVLLLIGCAAIIPIRRRRHV